LKEKTSNSLLLIFYQKKRHKKLKENGKVLAKKYELATVLFTDFEGFTNYSENLPPKKLVESIDYYFSKFDEIIDKYDLEKLKL
jgi:class 3 adenylate cyclase